MEEKRPFSLLEFVEELYRKQKEQEEEIKQLKEESKKDNLLILKTLLQSVEELLPTNEESEV